MKTGEQLALVAMKKEHKRLLAAAARAKKECDEYIDVGSEMIKAHQEFAHIVRSKMPAKEALPKLDELQERGRKHDRIRKKDFMKLVNKQHDTQFAAEDLLREIQNLEFRLSLRRS